MLVLMMTMVLAAEPQDASIERTRAEEHQIAREEKAQHLEPPKRSVIEKALHEIETRRIMERFKAGVHGFHPLIGGMESGAGFALGTSYIRGPAEVFGQLSLKGYQQYGLQLSTPRRQDPLFAKVRAEYTNFSQMPFYGIGSDTRQEDRSNFRLEETRLTGELGLFLMDNVQVGARAGWVGTNVGDGTSTRVPALSQVSYSTALPASDAQPNYLEAGAFLTLDSRDEPGNPRNGSLYNASWSSFHDTGNGQYSFNRFDFEVQQYLPFFNQRRVIALRARAALTRTGEDQEIPFYMLPSLGGSKDLRGFADSRFRDANTIVFNAEYRWEVFSGLDMAIFGDAGQVARSIGDFDFGDMKTAGGLGFRFNTAKSVFCRVDVGYSREGTRVALNFGHVF